MPPIAAIYAVFERSTPIAAGRIDPSFLERFRCQARALPPLIGKTGRDRTAWLSTVSNRPRQPALAISPQGEATASFHRRSRAASHRARIISTWPPLRSRRYDGQNVTCMHDISACCWIGEIAALESIHVVKHLIAVCGERWILRQAGSCNSRPATQKIYASRPRRNLFSNDIHSSYLTMSGKLGLAILGSGIVSWTGAAGDYE